jgi:hypothetical protein
MDPVDVLTMAVQVAQMIRSADDPEAVIVGGYRVLGLAPPDDRHEAMAIRIARLLSEAGDRRAVLDEYLRKNAGPLFLNRAVGWPGGDAAEAGPIEPDPEALRLFRFIQSDEGQRDGRNMLADGWGSFQVADRTMQVYFGGRAVVERAGRSLTVEEAGDPQPGDRFTMEKEDLPSSVRGLIAYPVANPVLFTFEIGGIYWSVWQICCAFADQFQRIYEHPERFGVWGHDLTDLCIEGLTYYPKERLIAADVGS